MDVLIIDVGRAAHVAGCSCGMCDSNGHAYGKGIIQETAYFRIDGASGEFELWRGCAPTAHAATANARQWLQQQGYRDVIPSELDMERSES